MKWGGSADPAAYAHLLNFCRDNFLKSTSPDFFIISAGLDNAAPDQGNIYIDEYNYLREMNQAVPGIFNQIDGMSSHSYPNPGFSQAPDITSAMGVGSFMQERNLIRSMSNKTLPVFITETGWSSQTVTEDEIVSYYDQTFKTIWNDPGIVAVTRFSIAGFQRTFWNNSLSSLHQDTKPNNTSTFILCQRSRVYQASRLTRYLPQKQKRK